MLQIIIMLKEKVLLDPKIKIQVQRQEMILENIISWKFTITI